MRNFKIFIWIFIVFIIQTAVLARLRFFGAVPSLVLPYLICVALLEDEFKTVAVISVICAAAAASLCGREFVITVIFYVYAAFLVYALRKKPMYIKTPVKAMTRTFIISGIFEIILYAVQTLSLSYSVLLYGALPTAVINAVIALVIYPVLKRTMYKDDEKKLLIGDIV